MNDIVRLILKKHFVEANQLIETRLAEISNQKLFEMKKMLVSASYTDLFEDFELLDEAPRIKIVKARIRNGKVQRRKKVSNVQGFTFRQGRLKRMSPVERRNRKLGQKRGKIKRRAKINMALRKRARSMRKRQSIGLR